MNGEGEKIQKRPRVLCRGGEGKQGHGGTDLATSKALFASLITEYRRD